MRLQLTRNGKNEENELNTTECTLCAETEATRNRRMQQINQYSPEIIQDNADLLELEHKYDNLQLTLSERRVVNDYIACILSRQERMEILIYYAGKCDAEK